MNKRITLTALAHNAILQHLNPGDSAIDATVGNGHDCLFLSKQVGKKGLVFGFDVQQQAIEATYIRLECETQFDNYKLFQLCHSKMDKAVPLHFHGLIKAIMFNLGYLPGSDKQIITEGHTSLKALELSKHLLAINGIITIAAYPGHPGGKEETEQIKQWGEQCKTENFSFQQINVSDKTTAPRLFILKKLAL